jgi:O-succinylbenzoate synthase
MRAVSLHHYKLPFHANSTLRAAPSVREGLIIRLTENGKEGLGEVAPLPGFSRETLREATDEARRVTLAWQTAGAPEDRLLTSLKCPSVAFGMSCAMAELDGSLPPTLNAESALLGAIADMGDLIRRLSRTDRRLVKIKVGRVDATDEGRAISALIQLFPDVTLRLDANRAWHLDDALRFAVALNEAARRRVAFIEEPCRSPELTRQFAQQTKINIAFDESLRDHDLSADDTADIAAIVVKPTLTGSLARCRELIRNAGSTAAVISSGFESSLGLTQLARFAAAETPDMPPGLDTADAFEQQLVRAFPGCDKPVVGLSQLAMI